VFEGYGFNSTASTVYTIPCIGTGCSTTCITTSNCSVANGVIFSNQCFICGFSDTFVNRQCVSRCPQNQTWTGSSCQCIPGYSLINNNCLPSSYCPNSYVWNGAQCICQAGYYNISGQCQQCPTNANYNGIQCACNSGYVLLSGQCYYQCGTNSYMDNSGNCVCMLGYQRNSLNQCVLTVNCPGNQTYSPTTGQCICSSNYLSYIGNCYPICPGNVNNSVIYQGACVCI
jgi:hypothetical protein